MVPLTLAHLPKPHLPQLCYAMTGRDNVATMPHSCQHQAYLHLVMEGLETGVVRELMILKCA